MNFIVYMISMFALLFSALAVLQVIENIFNYVEIELKKARKRRIIRAKIRAMRLQRAKFYSLVIY